MSDENKTETTPFIVSANYKGKHPKSPEELAALYAQRKTLKERRKTATSAVPTEVLNTENVIRHRELCKELNRLYATKNKAYGDSFGNTFKKLGLISAVTRITDKYNRLINLAINPKDEKLVADESIKDTLLDLANYCIMTRMALEDTSNK